MADHSPYTVAAAVLAHVKDALETAGSAPITTEFADSDVVLVGANGTTLAFDTAPAPASR